MYIPLGTTGISSSCAPSLQMIVLASVELGVNVASDTMIEPPQSHDPIILSTFPKAQLKVTISLQIKKLSALAAVHFHERKGEGSWLTVVFTTQRRVIG